MMNKKYIVMLCLFLLPQINFGMLEEVDEEKRGALPKLDAGAQKKYLLQDQGQKNVSMSPDLRRMNCRSAVGTLACFSVVSCCILCAIVGVGVWTGFEAENR